eukprot:1406683-Lingulodinium_polyedra.AAC.1
MSPQRCGAGSRSSPPPGGQEEREQRREDMTARPRAAGRVNEPPRGSCGPRGCAPWRSAAGAPSTCPIRGLVER